MAGMSNTSPLIVFDWNGTILADTVASWKAGNECLKFYGAQPITLSHYRKTFHFPVLHFYHLNGLDTDTVLAKKDEANVIFQTAYERLARHARTRHGAKPLLSQLSKCGATSMILSNYRTERIEAQTKRLGIREYFTHIDAYHCSGTSVLHSTTKAERLKAYMDAHGHSPESTYIIGDSHEEPEVARLLGLTSIGITDGYISTSRLRAAQPDYIITHLMEVMPIIAAR